MTNMRKDNGLAARKSGVYFNVASIGLMTDGKAVRQVQTTIKRTVFVYVGICLLLFSLRIRSRQRSLSSVTLGRDIFDLVCKEINRF